MQADFWHDRWDNNEIGFHQAEVNAFLESHWSDFSIPTNSTVLVPLCGKSLDMLWLRERGYNVVGVELSQKALDEFVSENNLSASDIIHDKYDGYELPDMRLYCGDFFHLTRNDTDDIMAVYDRASLIALPPEMRKAYVAHILELVDPGTSILLVTMEYDQSKMAGPPFSVHESEVRTLYNGASSIEVINQVTFERKGQTVNEKVYRILI